MNQFIFSFISFNCYSVFGNPVVLKSQIPAEPIEDPKTWSWGLHPDNGLDYSAKVNYNFIWTRFPGNVVLLEWIHSGVLS